MNLEIDDDEDVPPGFIELGSSIDGNYVIMRHPHIDLDMNGCGEIVFSPEQARELARLLVECADECEIAQIPRC